MQVCKNASMQVCKYASMQVCKYASMQVCKYAKPHDGHILASYAKFRKSIARYGQGMVGGKLGSIRVAIKIKNVIMLDYFDTYSKWIGGV